MTVGTKLDKYLPRWKTWLTSIVAIGGAVGAMYVWGSEAIDKAVVTEGELAGVMQQLQIQKDQEKLMELNRDVVAERFANEAEKELVMKEIERLQKELDCLQKNKCEE